MDSSTTASNSNPHDPKVCGIDWKSSCDRCRAAFSNGQQYHQNGEADFRQEEPNIVEPDRPPGQESLKPQGRTGRARGLEPYRAFPIDALPAPLAEYVRQGALALHCDPAYLALPCLAVAAGLIGYTRVLRLKRRWYAPAVLWTLVVADSGSLKTPAFRLITDYLFTLQKHLELEYNRKLAEYTKAMEEWEAASKAAKNGKGQSPGEKPVPPVRRTVFTSDATIEAVAELIGENPRGLLVACDELAAWLGSFSRYKGKAGGTDLPRWLSMHSAGGFAYHRKTGDRRRIVVSSAAVSIAGGIQPGILAQVMAGEFIEAGLASRLLIVMPPRPMKKWTELEIDADTEKRYHGLLESLYKLELDGEDPQVLKLSPQAKAAWVHWYDAWSREQNAVEGELAAAFSKLEEAAARFALLHHVVTRADRGESDLSPVEAGSIEAGVTLARWFAQESRRVYAVLAESDEQRDLRQRVEFIQAKGGTITARSLQKSNSRKYPTADAAALALEALAQAGLGEWAERLPTQRGGRPTRFFTLQPTADKTDTTSGEGAEEECDSTQPPSDTTSDTTPPAPQNSRGFGGFVGNVGRRNEDSRTACDPAGGQETTEGSVGRQEVVSGAGAEEDSEVL